MCLGIMIVKLYFHVLTFLKKVILKMLFFSRIQIGTKTTWRRNFHIWIEHDGSIKIGKNCFFNNGCSIIAHRKVYIGSGCLFGENVKIYDNNHKYRNKELPIKDQGYSTSTVKIGDHCWIGSNVVILKNANIGNNCIIGTGCIIDENVPSDTIVKVMQNKQLSKY